jgi:hypothetical protein
MQRIGLTINFTESAIYDPEWTGKLSTISDPRSGHIQFQIRFRVTEALFMLQVNQGMKTLSAPFVRVDSLIRPSVNGWSGPPLSLHQIRLLIFQASEACRTSPPPRSWDHS